METFMNQYYFIVGAGLMPIAAVVAARFMWRYQDGGKKDNVDLYGAVVIATLVTWVAWGLVPVVALLWVLVQAAKPGRFQLPKYRRRHDRLQERIKELEAEMDIKDSV